MRNKKSVKRDERDAYFGIFTFGSEEDPNLRWTGQIMETRIEVCPLNNHNSNRMCVMYVFGRNEMKPGEISIAEIVPLSPHLMRDGVDLGDTLLVKYGSHTFGNFKLLYIGPRSPIDQAFKMMES